MKVAIIGFEIEGRAALRYWQNKGADITICDRDLHKVIPPGIDSQLGDNYLHGLDRFDVIMRSPGIHPKIILADNPGVTDKIRTSIDEFLRVCPTKHTIGVTGTKGKGTTSMLITNMLETAGKHVFLGGNFGFSPLDFLDKLTEDSWVVLELSSFMLYDITRSTHIAVCLMVHPEHLDWHGDEHDYLRSKQNLFALQKDTDVAIYYADSITSHKLASASPGDKIAYYDEPGAYVQDGKIMIDQTELCKTNELKLLGKHNWQNVCAAVTAFWQVEQMPDVIREVLTTFTGLPHRLEFVRGYEGVSYYNDSFASDPYATQAAIDAIPGKKVLVIGGYERMLPLESLVASVHANQTDIRTIILVGSSAERVATAFKDSGYTNFHLSPATTMPEIVSEASARAEKGDSVVLSPGFASFDMFANFEDRGLQFKEAVHKL